MLKGDKQQIEALRYVYDGILDKITFVESLIGTYHQSKGPDYLLQLVLEKCNLRAEAVVYDTKINILCGIYEG